MDSTILGDPEKLGALRALVSPIYAGAVPEAQRGAFLAVPAGYDVSPLEHLQDAPNRIRESRVFRDVESLGAYVARFGTPDTIATADKVRGIITAEIDYHRPISVEVDSTDGDESILDACPSHSSHSASFIATFSPEYEAWRDIHEKWLAQHTFGEFLEDRAPDVVVPDAADIMDMVMKFEATRKVEFKSAVRLANGTRQITFNEADNGPKGAVTFPEAFLLQIPIYDGAPAERILVRIRYDIDGGVLKFKPIIAERKRLEERAFGACVDRFEAIVAGAPCGPRPIYFGPAPAALPR